MPTGVNSKTGRGTHFLDLQNRKFGKLVVLSYAGLNKLGRAEWSCLCKCGRVAIAPSNGLIEGRNRSCGCSRKESWKKNPRRFKRKPLSILLKNIQKKYPKALISGIRRIKIKKGTVIYLNCQCSKNVSPVCKRSHWIQAGYLRQHNGLRICSHCVSYKGGHKDENGYIRIGINGRLISQHKLVMEKILGRKLLKGESVHHGVGGRSDNRPENLSLRAPAKHPKGWAISEMRDYVLSIPKRLGGLK